MHGCWRLMETISDAWMLETGGDNQWRPYEALVAVLRRVVLSFSEIHSVVFLLSITPK